MEFFKKKKLVNSQFFLNISQAFVLQVLGMIVGFTSNIILARSLGVGTYGLYSLGLSWMLMFSLISRLGFDMGSNRFIPVYLDNNRWDKVKAIILSSQVLVLLFSTIIYGIVYFFINYVLNLTIEKKQFFSLFFLVLPFYSLIIINGSIFRALKRINLALTSLIVISFVFSGFIGYCHYIKGIAISNSLIAKSYLIINLVVLLLYNFALFKTNKKEFKTQKPSFELNTWLKISIPLLFIDSLQLLMAQSDLLMLGVLSTTEEVGFYQAGIKISAIAAFGLGAVTFILAPEISKLYHKGAHEELQQKISQSAKLLFIFATLVSAIILVFGGFILSLFGNNFTTAYYAMAILTFSQFTTVFHGTAGFVMSLTGHQNEALRIVLITVIINLGLNYVMIPLYGIEGAAISTTLATIIRNFWMAYCVRKYLNIKSTVLY